MLNRKNPEVLIVGAGPVGLFAAVALTKRGIRVEVVDKEWRTGAHSYALALQPQTLPLLAELGVLDRVLENAYPVRKIAFYDSTTRRAELSLLPATASGCLAVLRQDLLEDLLEEALHHLGVFVAWNHEVSHVGPQPDRVETTVDKLEKDSLGYAVAHTEWVVAKSTEQVTPFVLGTDGHRSRVRRALALDFPEVGPAQHFAVFEFQSDYQADHEMRVVFGPDTTDVLWPLPGGQCRWSFQLTDFAAPDESRIKDRLAMQLGATPYPLLATENLRAFLAQRAPWFKASIGEIQWRIVVRFERRLAGAFGRERLWLAGDAAHITGPVGMQSMNAGFFEARDLADALTNILRRQGALDELTDYNRRWTGAWRQLLGVEQPFRAGPKADPWIAAHAARLVGCLPGHGAELTALGRQLGLEV